MLDFLQETLELCGKELLSRFGGKIAAETKSDASLVTAADLASEKIILERVRKFFPEDTILSEESGFSTTQRLVGKRIWIVDPLDGTTNFANGYPYFCISIGCGIFQENGQVAMEWGGIGDPCQARIFLAGRGKGATVNGQKISVAKPRPLEKSFLVTGFYYAMGDKLEGEIRKFSRVAALCQAIRRDGAAALDLALVANGTFDAFWERGLAPWDVAAGSLLVQEAGGVVTNYEPRDVSAYNIEGDGIVAGSDSATSQLNTLFWS